MKKILPIIAATFLFAACGNAGEETKEVMDEAETKIENAVEDMSNMVEGKKDPVCEMDYEASWTEYSVQGTDTTWFCSETCKEAFEGNPSKYMEKS